MIDIERLVSNYLRNHADVIALGTRVRATNPGEQTGGIDLPWVRVRMLDTRPVTRSYWLVSYMVQLDVYAGATGGQPEANGHAFTVAAALYEMPGEHAEGVVTRATSSLAHIPDGDYEPARERVLVTADVTAHPLRAAVAA